MTPPVIPECQPWSKDGGANGVLVLHGFTGCPQSIRPLAEAFVAEGYTVDVPLLPGHGTAIEDMLSTGWDDWAQAAEAAYEALAARCEQVVVAGLSMGGSLTAWLASRHPEIRGIVLVNPAVRISDEMTEAVRQMVEAGEEVIPGIGGNIADPEAHEVAYEGAPLRPLLSLATAADELRPQLARITCPVLLLSSPQDQVVPPSDSDELAATVSGPVERVTLERSYHVATLDYDRDLICAEAVAFAARVL